MIIRLRAALALFAPAMFLAATSFAGGRGAGTPGEHHFGLLHHATGGASLSAGGDGRLHVELLSGGADDGVAITLTAPSPTGGVTPGWLGVVDFGQAGALTPGSSFTIAARDQFDNPFASLHLSESGGGLAAVSFTQSLCDSCPVTVELLLDGVVVRSTEFPVPAPPVLAMGNIGSTGNDGVQCSVGNRGAVIQFDVVNAHSPMLLQLMDGSPPVDCDEMHVRLNGLPPGTRYIGNLMMTGTGMPVFTVVGEALVAHELAHVAQAQAQMRGIGDQDGDGEPDIGYDNIGSSGQDGVRVRKMIPVTVPDITGGMVSVDCDWGQTGALPPGSVMRYVVRSPSGTGLPPEEHALVIAETGGMGAVSMEKCAPCGPSAVLVEAIYKSVVMDRVYHPSLPSGPLAVCPIGSQGSENGTLDVYRQSIFNDSGSQGETLVMEVQSAASGQCTLTGSLLGPVTADRVRVRCIPLDGTVAPIQSVALLASDVPSFSTRNMRERINQLEAVLPALGLLARSIGGAALTITPDGTLVVRDMDDDGDGVEMDFGDYAGGSLAIDLSGAGPAGSYYELSYGAKQGSMGKAKVFDDGEESKGAGGPNHIGFESDTCPTCPIQVDLLSCDGQVVGSQLFIPPLPPVLVTSDFRFNKIIFTLPTKDEDEELVIRDELVIQRDTPSVMTLPGGAGGLATTVRIRMPGMPPGPPADDLSFMSVTAQQGSGFTITDASLRKIPAGFVAKKNNGQLAGKKRVIPGAPADDYVLMVSNIGSSGQDGAIVAGEDEDCDDQADPNEEIEATLFPQAVPATARMAIKSKGLCCPNDGPASTFEVSTDIVGTGQTHDVFVDFSQTGAPTYSVKVSNAGAAQGTVTGMSSSLAARAMASSHAIVSVMASRASNSGSLIWSPRSNIRWSAPVDFVLSTGVVLTGDELEITAENNSVPCEGMLELAITGENLPGDYFIIVDDRVLPTNDCPADISSGGGSAGAVNIDDLLAVIGAWGPCQPAPATCPADIAPPGGDTQVNIDDLLAVIGAWGPCS